MSRRVFLQLVWSILRFADPSRVELLYIDTDSLVVCTNKPRFRDNVRPELLAEFDEKSSEIFEDPLSDRSQAGKFKVEGEYRSVGRSIVVSRLSLLLSLGVAGPTSRTSRLTPWAPRTRRRRGA
jgi:hypothetical protein